MTKEELLKKITEQIPDKDISDVAFVIVCEKSMGHYFQGNPLVLVGATSVLNNTLIKDVYNTKTE